MVPKTKDGRVLFAIPWHGRVLVGTTDTATESLALEPRALPEEIEFLLEHAAQYLVRDPTPADVLSAWAGLRPLVGGEEQGSATSALSRDHTITISDTGLITVTGGKWTTYRKMAEDTVDHAAAVAGLEDRPCGTRELAVQGFHPDAGRFGELAHYGSDAPAILELRQERAGFAERLHPEHAATGGEVAWAARREMARTVEDVLSRRTRMLLLDARAAIGAAPAVAAVLAAELGRDEEWAAAQVRSFRALAAGYLPDPGRSTPPRRPEAPPA
jgi:glycerol-3-phosphate dehydrogenase